jgi:hypothetical protein
MIRLMPLSRPFATLQLVLVISVLVSPVLMAAPLVNDIDSADVELPDDTSATRQTAFRQALAKVLIKMSGQREVLDVPATEEILANAPRYVQSYHKTSATGAAAGSRSTDGMLHVEFDGSVLERMLINAGLPVWSGTRPATLVWLAVEENNRRYVLAENSTAAVLQALQQAAAERGVPVIVPLMDQTDQRLVEYVDIRGEFTSRLQQAAKRYNAPNLLIGTLRLTASDTWHVKWRVLTENDGDSWTDENMPLEQALQSGVDRLADVLSSRYAFVSSPGGQLSEYILSVDNISTLQHYAQVLGLLQKLVFVEGVTPIRVAGAQVRFKIRMHGSLQELQRALGLRRELQELESKPVIAADLNRPVSAEPASTSLQRDRIDLYFALNT